ncbi:MAG: hypothetical protein JWM50_1338 [Microbacteriaceae bacterium]|jgi:hypothetical protein|nr:hypothetical protein [Microbacteriaceae bacterium]
MTTKDSDEFDPRFDPAFQRGFEATESRFRSRAADPRATERPVAEQAPPPSSGRRATPPVESQQDGYALAQPVGPSAASRETAPTTGDGAAPTDGAVDDAAPTRPNPFLIALIVVSVALVAGGVWGVQAAREPFLNTDAAVNVDYSGLQMLMTFAPMAIALGIATAVGILFVYAIRWRGAR